MNYSINKYMAVLVGIILFVPTFPFPDSPATVEANFQSPTLRTPIGTPYHYVFNLKNPQWVNGKIEVKPGSIIQYEAGLVRDDLNNGPPSFKDIVTSLLIEGEKYEKIYDINDGDPYQLDQYGSYFSLAWPEIIIDINVSQEFSLSIGSTFLEKSGGIAYRSIMNCNN